VGYGGHPDQYKHNGGNDGFESLLFMDDDGGWGIALMGNSDSFEYIYPHIVETIAKAQGWQYPAKKLSLPERLTLIAARLGVRGAFEDFDRACAADPQECKSSATLNSFGYQLLARGQTGDATTIFKRNAVLHQQRGLVA
jgi:hypothetical protein